jgi:thiosulfate/3-mercaptopyruvate sulfurtransferase
MKLKTTVFAALVIILTCGSSFLPATEKAASVAMPPVVTTDWLAEHLEDPDLVILHIGPQGSYEERHISGARSASLRRMIRTNDAGIRDEMLAADDIAEALSELGIGNSSQVVIYFANESAAWAAARYLLTLEYAGMTGRVSYLDGGLPKWTAEERSVSGEVPSYQITDISVAVAPGVLVDTDWLRIRYENSGIAVVDGRPAEEYSGLSGHWERLGNIPGAGSIPFFTLLAEAPPYLLKNREELSNMFHEAGMKTGDTVVVYCGTGLWASLPYLAARYLGYEVRLYDGSFQEWSSIMSLPIAAQAKNEN